MRRILHLMDRSVKRKFLKLPYTLEVFGRANRLVGEGDRFGKTVSFRKRNR